MGVCYVRSHICCNGYLCEALRLSKYSLGNTTVGQIVNLMSNDVNRFDFSLIFAHYIWMAPLNTVLITVILWFKLGVSALVGVAAMLLTIPLQSWMGRMTSKLRAKTAVRTDERVKLMNEIITGIQVIKMYTWEIPFAKLVSTARKSEIKQVRYSSYLRGVYLSFILFTTRTAVYTTVLAYTLFGNEITAEKVFVLTSYYSIICWTMTLNFPQAIAQIAEARVSIQRIQKFMLYEEIDVNTRNTEASHSQEISVVDATAKWSSNVTENTLSKVSLTVKPGALVAVIGQVGAGKTSLLQAILGELPLISGSIKVDGKISYSCQEPWTFGGTIRQNILFGQEYDRKRYNKVVEACALSPDFKQFPYGDSTVVGERGVSLSGGQRARLTLARAVYNDADVFLLDDPLSAVDSHVGRHLFDECIAGYLSSKTRILVTHQLQYLKKVDEIIILNNGKIEGRGNYEELQKTGLDFAMLLKHDEEDPDKIDSKEGKGNSLSRQTSRGSSRTNSESMDADEIEEKQKVEESRSHGSVSGSVYGRYFAAGGHPCVIVILFLLFFMAQALASACDFWVTFWTNMEELRQKDILLEKSLGTATEPGFSFANESLVPEFNTSFTEKMAHVNGDPLYLVFNTENCIYIYSTLIFLTIVVTLARSFLFFTVCMRASVNLHNAMFQSIAHATMRFFNTNPSGRILNRFSKDMGSIDEMLPQTMVDSLQIFLSLLGIIIMVSIMNFWLVLPTLIIGIIFYYLRNIYLSTSRSVKRLDGVARSPVFSHLNASLQGLSTIRAFGAQDILIKEFDNFQDTHSSAWFMFITTSRAFGLWLDLFCFVYISLVTISFLVMGGDTFGGNVGLAITQSIGLTGMFQWGMRQSAEMENQMTSVERVVEYTDVEKEPPLVSPPDSRPPMKWPFAGKISFEKLSLFYNPDDPPVLKNLNFAVESHEKVGIVGRTGAGKSSLIAALFRLTDLKGSITIDGLETTKTMGLHDLRSKISIIPQEPFIFSGTLRKNLDPFDEFPDYVLKKALEEVELKDAVEDLAGGINAVMSEGGSNLSVGQRQLVCLARAIIRNNKILVLDEATANVDPKMDAVIQKTIREKFSDCTVLTIAHRLHTVMDSDRVLVMDSGEVAEFDKPFVLLQNTNGILFGMVQKTGKAMADTLHKIAKESYFQSKKSS
ncbi:ATP-binding cassette sub-family C member 4-like isoform X2 [Ischnura elegans]|uniref:ATP-binding cassette sub-family C member 4-like isoform X2 n=1 Tax=Ischnura elegans TaxID=197161 RepID=UPI001ED8BF3F|nr:ATP-binding cassette sub-family C member 4-like isoform X2 [Ischnura elegans]